MLILDMLLKGIGLYGIYLLANLAWQLVNIIMVPFRQKDREANKLRMRKEPVL